MLPRRQAHSDYFTMAASALVSDSNPRRDIEQGPQATKARSSFQSWLTGSLYWLKGLVQSTSDHGRGSLSRLKSLARFISDHRREPILNLLEKHFEEPHGKLLEQLNEKGISGDEVLPNIASLRDPVTERSAQCFFICFPVGDFTHAIQIRCARPQHRPKKRKFVSPWDASWEGASERVNRLLEPITRSTRLRFGHCEDDSRILYRAVEQFWQAQPRILRLNPFCEIVSCRELMVRN